MDFDAILKAAGPVLVQLLNSVVSQNHLSTAPTTAPSVPHPSGDMVHDAVIADLQAFLNAVPGLLATRLKVDGWLGDKTKAAIELGISKMKAALGLP